MISNHYWLRNTGGNVDLFQEMFRDSKKAKRFAQSAGKRNYVIPWGLAPYVKIRIMKEVTFRGPRLLPKFTLCFDESFNKSSCSKQRDVHLLYYKKETKQVESVYLGLRSWVMVLLKILWTTSKECMKN